MKCEFCAVASCVPESYAVSTTSCDVRGLSGISWGGGGTESGSQLFETQKREGSCKCMPVIM